MSARPLLYVDVDGPLVVDEPADPHKPLPGYAAHRLKVASYMESQPGPRSYREALKVWLNAAHGPALLALPYDLVWATSWEHEANKWISPLLGLPELPFVPFTAERERREPFPGLASREDDPVHWKTRVIMRHAAGRPYAWVDDEITDADTAWVADHYPAPALLRCIDPRRGMDGRDFRTLTTWAASLLDNAGQT
jgi:hypothetical protein